MRSKSFVSALGIGLALVLAADYVAIAATGQSLILGRSNSANKVTTVSRTTNGQVLERKTKTGSSAPLKVNGKGKVTNLNADRVDGNHASGLGVRTLVFEKALALTSVSSLTLALPSVPAGDYVVTVNGWIYGPATANLECFVKVPTTGRFSAHTWNRDDSDGFYTVTGAGVVSVPTAQDLEFRCVMTSGNYTSYSQSPLQVGLTKISSLNSTTLARPVPSRTAPRSASR